MEDAFEVPIGLVLLGVIAVVFIAVLAYRR
jgi:hypothetical protein